VSTTPDGNETTGTRPTPAPGRDEPTVAIPVRPGAATWPTGQGTAGGSGETTQVIPAGTGTEPPGSGAAPGRGAPDAHPELGAGDGEAGVFPDSEYTLPPSRAGAHWWGALIALVLSPVSWFLLTDGSARLFWSMLADPADVNPAGYLSFTAGLIALAAVLLAARWSSVGPIIAGSISALAGLAFLVLPVQTLDFLAGFREGVEELGGFGRNLYAYTVESGMKGTFLIGGVVLVAAGVISHGARRKGRREEKARVAVRAARGESPFP
jgi:hypothetical protein